MTDLKDANFRYFIKIVDNDSGDDLSDLAKTYANEPIAFFKTKTNRGFGAGHNFLFEQAPSSSRLTLVLNPDTKFVEPGTTRRLITSIDRHRKCGAVGPALMSPMGPQYWDHGELKGWKARIAGLAGGSNFHYRKEAGRVAWVSGAVLLIKSEQYHKLGGFDESFFLFKEEEDLCLRLRKAGYKVWYDPSITIFHAGGASGASKDSQMAPSIEHFNQKHLNERSLITRIAKYLYERYSLWE